MKLIFQANFNSYFHLHQSKIQQLTAWIALIAVVGLGGVTADAQRRGTAQPALPGVVSEVTWSESGDEVEYSAAGKRFRFDLNNLEKTEIEARQQPLAGADNSQAARSDRRPARQTGIEQGLDDPVATTGRYLDRPTRGRQHTQVESPDGQWLAQYKEWNLVLTHRQNDQTIEITNDGNELVHYGTASWVYGEELGQKQAMWWTPDSKKILYYKFDDRQVKPFYLLRGWSEINTELYPEYYPKAGASNPIAELFVYDLE